MKKISSQLNFFSQNINHSEDKEFLVSRSSHGGGLRKGKRKVQRPISIKKSMHIVLKSKIAKNQYSLLHPKNRFVIEKIIREQAKKNQLIIRFA